MNLKLNIPSAVGSNVAQLLAYPAGKLFDTVLPNWSFNVFGRTISLNPGPFNMKEHMVITIMANVGFGAPYTNYVVFVQYIPRFFDMPWASDFGYQILIGLSTNFIGYGLAGLTRRFLVYPPQAIWYANLATIALNRAFHSGKNEPANGWKISRMRFFLYCFVGMFVYCEYSSIDILGPSHSCLSVLHSLVPQLHLPDAVILQLDHLDRPEERSPRSYLWLPRWLRAWT